MSFLNHRVGPQLSKMRLRYFSYLFLKKVQTGSKRTIRIYVQGIGQKVTRKVHLRKVKEPLYYLVLNTVPNINS